MKSKIELQWIPLSERSVRFPRGVIATWCLHSFDIRCTLVLHEHLAPYAQIAHKTRTLSTPCSSLSACEWPTILHEETVANNIFWIILAKRTLSPIICEYRFRYCDELHNYYGVCNLVTNVPRMHYNLAVPEHVVRKSHPSG